ncbi:MAG TPA: protein kinase [Gemmataceae bacterium]|jgi:tRNA A-37 threonylcarbamoyl transferase component Bud32
MLAQLEVIAGADKGRVFSLTPGTPLVIGRGRQTVTRLNDLRVSRVHCQIEYNGPTLVLKDLNSVGGTFVNNQPITEHILNPGDIIELGETKLRLQCDDLADQNTIPPERPAEPFPINLSLDAAVQRRVTPPPRLDKPPAPVPVVLPTDLPMAEALPAAVPFTEALPAAIPIPDDLPAAIPISDPQIPAAPPAAPLKVLPGERLGELSGSTLGNFHVGIVLAKGKSGVVFRAIDVRNYRDVALKILRPEFARNETEVQRFIRSMKTMMPLRHPNLVSLHGAGKKGPYCWVAMEYVEGESLSQVIHRIGVAGMLDWRHGFRVAVHLGRALEFAHSRHIVHRNLTPQNVLIRESDRAALLGDLMLAKAIEGSMALQITQANEMLGDVRYMSPEQTFGPDQVDERSDLYSLGALLYATLSGQPPFEGGSLIETITKIRQAPVVMPKKYQMSIPDAFQAIVLRMLAKRPEDRYQTAEEMLRELERVARYQGLTV